MEHQNVVCEMTELFSNLTIRTQVMMSAEQAIGL